MGLDRRTWLALPALALSGLVAVLVGNTLASTSTQLQVTPVTVPVDAEGAANRLSRAVQLQTVSMQGADSGDGFAFLELHDLVEHAFPRVHATLKREVIADYSLLYTWTGADPTLPPVLLMAHQDVVPVDPTAQWTHPPFSGVVAEGFVWGRGTLDDKQNMFAQLEAVELLLTEGLQPQRTIYLAYGHDEEIGGTGAVATAATLAARRISLDWVLDEGGALVSGGMPGVSGAPAFVGIAEKGYVTVELTAHADGGHTSMPPPHTASGRIGAAVARLEAHPLPAEIRGPAALLLDALGPEMGFGMRLVFANRWLLSPVIKKKMTAKPASAAMLRTTTAVTMLEGSVKENVLPTVARARVNFRILPGDSIDSVVAHVRETIADDGIEVRAAGDIASEPSPLSPVDGPEFAVIARTIREIFPETPVAPFLVLGATDGRHYAGLTRAIYRFSPTELDNVDLKRIHGTDERIAVDSYARAIGFYAQLIRNVSDRP